MTSLPGSITIKSSTKHLFMPLRLSIAIELLIIISLKFIVSVVDIVSKELDELN